MGRKLGSENTVNRWEFILKNPYDCSVLFSKQFVSIKAMHNDFANFFTKAQLSSYASRSRNCPKIVEINKLE